MNTQIHNFLTLLGKAVNTDSDIELIHPVNWSEVFSLAEAHNVVALVFETALDVPEFMQSADYSTYMLKAMAQVADQAKRTEAFLELYRNLSERNLHPIVLKGIVCRQLYGEYCDHRPSGDEDILIQKEEFETVKMAMKELGYIAEHEATTPGQLDEIQEITFYDRNSDFHVELHINPFGRKNKLRRRLNDYFMNVFEHPGKIDVDGVELWTMSPTDHFLFLVLHAFKHLTGTGMGIRQVVDILLYDKQYGEEIGWTYIKEKLQSVNAYDVLSDMIHIGNRYLGFHLPELDAPKCPEALMEELILCGVFGNATQAQRSAVQMTMAAVAGWEGDGVRRKRSTMLRTLFPGRAHLMDRYPELKEKPWLLPLRWVQRWGRFLKKWKNADGNLAKESMAISQRRIELLKKYKIL